MPPKKKKQPKNAFYFYMEDWRKMRAAEGQRLSLAEVSQFCSEDWNNLSEVQKKKYKEMEAVAKQRDKTDLSNKYNSLGTTFEAIEKEEREKRDAVIAMDTYISNTLARVSASREALMNQVFHLVHANVYCYWGQKQIYIPCEVSISKFSLKEGVISTYHVFPAPCTENGNIPLGYKFQVRQNSEAVHGIPEPSEFSKSLEYSYAKMSSDINQFLRPDGGEEIPPLYTLDMDETNNNCHISAVKTFFEHLAGDTYDNYRVYSLTRLFFKLYEACQKVAVREFSDHEAAFPVEGLAQQQLLKDVYNYCHGLSCEFHEQEEEHYQNCSTSFVKRWVFLICEFCCSALRIELVPGRHCVATAQINITWANEQPKPQSKPLPASTKSNAVVDSDEEDGAWSTVSKSQHGGVKNGERPKTTADRIQEGIRNLKVDNGEIISKMPQQPRVFKTGQSPHVMSEIKAESAPPSVRLPTTRGRGEMLTRALQQQQQQLSAPGTSFTSDDFPAIGADVRPGHVSKPSGSGWGRGFMM